MDKGIATIDESHAQLLKSMHDKGIKFIDQYPEPFKRRNRNEKVTAHGFSEFYENILKLFS